jgi:hypothetical protein
MEMLETNMTCPVDEIAAYIDGELSAEQEFELDVHFSSCKSCNDELNEQKQFLRGLDLSLKHEKEFVLPENFARVVTANAESTVSGLRRPTERFNALFICLGLFLFILFAMGSEVWSLVDGLAAVGGFFGHLFYSFFVGIAIIVRTGASQFQFGESAVIILCIAFAAFSLFVSRKVLRTRGV